MQSTTPFRPFFRTGGYGRRHGFTDSKRKLALPCPGSARSNTHNVQRNSHGSHRANGPKKNRTKRKHLVLKWVLGIFAALLTAGIGLFAYM